MRERHGATEAPSATIAWSDKDRNEPRLMGEATRSLLKIYQVMRIKPGRRGKDMTLEEISRLPEEG